MWNLISTKEGKNSLCVSTKIYVKHQVYAHLVNGSMSSCLVRNHELLQWPQLTSLLLPCLPPKVYSLHSRQSGPFKLKVHHVLLRICTEPLRTPKVLSVVSSDRLFHHSPLPSLLCRHTGLLALPLPLTCQASAVSGSLHFRSFVLRHSDFRNPRCECFHFIKKASPDHFI